MFEAILTRLAQSPISMVAYGQEMAFVANIQQFLETYEGLTEDQRAEMANARMDDDFWDFPEDSFMARLRPYNVDSNGILTIPVAGSLINDFGYTFYGWVTGYDYIWKAYERGMDDPEVKGIVLKVNSPGGEVSGNFDLVDFLASRRDEKPTLAVASDHSYSAAYNISAAMQSINVSRTGGVGSIGVVTMHIDLSEYLKKMGISVTFVHAGKHKVDGNPYQPLPEDVKKRMQSRIDGLYSIFVSSVASNRGMEEQAIRDTEALTYSAEESIEVGLADAVASFDDSMAAFNGKLAPSDGATTMSDKENGKPNAAKTPEAAEEQKAPEGLDAARTEGFEAGKAEGTKAERERINAIISCDEAKTRPAQAFNLAMKTNLSVDEVQGLLGDMPEEKSGSEKPEEKGAGKGGGEHFAAAMGKDNPEITGGPGEDADHEEGADPSASILDSYNQATGRRPAEK